MNQSAHDSWDGKLATYLQDLVDAQGELLAFLRRRRETLVSGEPEATTALNAEETQLAERLGELHQRRAALMTEAGDPASLEDAARRRGSDAAPGGLWEDARRNVGLLRHECVVNWLLTQRTLLHVSQLLQRVFRGDATYSAAGKPSQAQGGTLLDHQA